LGLGSSNVKKEDKKRTTRKGVRPWLYPKYAVQTLYAWKNVVGKLKKAASKKKRRGEPMNSVEGTKAANQGRGSPTQAKGGKE